MRALSSSDNQIEFTQATMIDEKRNLVKLIDPNISQNEIYSIVSSKDIIYQSEPSQLKYYVNFTYQSSDEFVRIAYLRSNLNWKIRYQLNLFEESILLVMADIRNDGKSRIDIENGELIDGDLNLRLSEQHRYENGEPIGTPSLRSISRVKEVAGLFIYPINQSFSIEGKTNLYLPMFRPRITVERYASIRKPFFGGAGNSHGKAQRSYRISTDRFLPRGNCLIREYDRLIGETFLPDLTPNHSHEFSIGQDPQIIYRENVTLISVKSYNESIGNNEKDFKERTLSIYIIDFLLKNVGIRSIPMEYKYEIYAGEVKLITNNSNFILDGSIIRSTMLLSTNDEEHFSYEIEVIN